MLYDGTFHALGCLVMGPLVMGHSVMGHFVMGRFVMGRFVCESYMMLYAFVWELTCGAMLKNIYHTWNGVPKIFCLKLFIGQCCGSNFEHSSWIESDFQIQMNILIWIQDHAFVFKLKKERIRIWLIRLKFNVRHDSE
jgi:hypothetical protein